MYRVRNLRKGLPHRQHRGGGSVKKDGIYDEVTAILQKAGKTVVAFSGIMSNPTYQKVQEGAKLTRENHIDV